MRFLQHCAMRRCSIQLYRKYSVGSSMCPAIASTISSRASTSARTCRVDRDARFERVPVGGAIGHRPPFAEAEDEVAQAQPRARKTCEEPSPGARPRGDVAALLQDSQRFVQGAVRDEVAAAQLVFRPQTRAVRDLSLDDSTFDLLGEGGGSAHNCV